MKKNLITLLFIIITVVLLSLVSKKYSHHSLNKSIGACVLAQVKKDKSLTKEEAEKYCVKEIKKLQNN
tara:strand:+ start:390 stop:593 length:204 start_codon:yes stop_codon:yes gene_type:complete